MWSHQEIVDVPAGKLKPVGECIYCGSTENLSEEHIIPLALWGTAILPEASCESCREITSKFETMVLKGDLWPVRVSLNLPSRTKHLNAPKSYPIEIERRGKVRQYFLDLNHYPVYGFFPRFHLPKAFESDQLNEELSFSMVDPIHFGGPSDIEVARRFGAEVVRIPYKTAPIAFAKMIGKIAYATAAADGLLRKLKGDCLVLPSIMGRENNIGHWVGCIVDESNVAHKGVPHEVNFVFDEKNGFLVAEVQIFRFAETPRYVVILGYWR